MTLYSIFGILGGIAAVLTLLRYLLKKPSNTVITFIQYFVALLFIFSGLIKENDTIGFSYKLEEYFEVFKTSDTQSLFNNVLNFSHKHALEIGFLILITEVMLGFMLLIGAWRILTLCLLFGMMAFFTFLTYYSAAYDVVKECGCFGDFLKMTPWESFWKDVLLLALIIILFIGQKHITPLFGKRMEKIMLVILLLFSVGFPLYTYNYLPVFDFRPYAIGKNIQEGMQVPPDAPRDSIVMTFIYEKEGKRIELTPEQIKDIDSTYKYVDRIDKVVRQGTKPAIQDFSIINMNGDDYTEQILNYDGYYFFLVCYDLQKTNRKAFDKINDFAKLCKTDNIPFIALTASSDQVEPFKKETGADFDFYLSDQTGLKTMIRANPGLMLLKKGTIIDMWHHNNIPSYSRVKEKYINPNQK